MITNSGWADDLILVANGIAVQKRSRFSYAILQQMSGEDRGQFFAGALTVTAGVQAPLPSHKGRYAFEYAAAIAPPPRALVAAGTMP